MALYDRSCVDLSPLARASSFRDSGSATSRFPRGTPNGARSRRCWSGFFARPGSARRRRSCSSRCGDLIGLRPNLDSLVEAPGTRARGAHAFGICSRAVGGDFLSLPRDAGWRRFRVHRATRATQGVLVLPSPVFHHQGHFRISLTANDAMLDRALDVLTAETGSRVTVATTPIADFILRGDDRIVAGELDVTHSDRGFRLAARPFCACTCKALDGDEHLLVRDPLGVNKLFFAISGGQVDVVELLHRPACAAATGPAGSGRSHPGHLARISTSRRRRWCWRSTRRSPSPRPSPSGQWILQSTRRGSVRASKRRFGRSAKASRPAAVRDDVRRARQHGRRRAGAGNHRRLRRQ